MKNENSADIFLRSSDKIEKERLFFKKVAEIENENSDIFSRSPAQNKDEKPVSLKDCFIYYQGRIMLGIVWASEFDVPETIKKQVCFAFKKIIGGNNF